MSVVSSDVERWDYKVRVIPDTVLHTRAKNVPENQDLSRLVAGMREVMTELKGVGIAAPQVGVSLRVFIMSYEGFNLSVVNPSITHRSGLSLDSEGCLSIPGQFYTVKRDESLVLSGFDHNWRFFQVPLSGFLARIAQHELDHLDGVTIDSRASGDAG